MRFGLTLLCALIFISVNGQQPDKEGSLVKWMTLQEAMEKIQKQPKPILMDFYTDWCGWCKHMMKTTYANPALAEYINIYFYPVKFDAEGKDTVEYLGKKYLPTSAAPRSPHELTVKLLQNKLMYPTTLFLNGYEKDKNEFRMNMLAAGYLDQQKIEPILVFTLENAFRNCTYDEFKINYDAAYHDSTIADKLKALNWMKPQEAFNVTPPKKKKTLVLINAEWCNTCRVMKFTSFNDTAISNYVKDKFDLVDFNAESSDTINYKGQLILHDKTPSTPFHPLALGLMRNNITFPSLVVLDENLDLVDVIPSYIQPAFLKDIVKFYGEEINKTRSWKDYMSQKKN
jgi:thioredoxin-related protein